jgi:enamine deaminase RidA (YjgF/YER057c/UK114 family)
MKQFRNPTDVHAPLAGYTHQIEINGPERLLVLSGQVGMRLDGTVPADPIEQIEAAFENLERNLAAAGMTLADVVKLTLYLTDEIDIDRRRQAVASRLGAHKPCMTLVYVAALASPQYRVELDAWASQAA